MMKVGILERTGKEFVMSHFKVLPRQSSGGTEEKSVSIIDLEVEIRNCDE
jgi:hypothetical protein